MRSSSNIAELRDMSPGSHVCWVVRDADEYVSLGAEVLAATSATSEKPVVFGPDGSARDELARTATVAADPRTAFLDGGPLEPGRMFAMFEEQSALAAREGYCGLRLVADMDWLLPLQPSTDEVLSFELLLDRHASRLGATIVCAYRSDSFDRGLLLGASCVHPIDIGHEARPQFKLIAGEDESWRLLGEVDVAVETDFGTAIGTALAAGPCTIDASGLDFLDIPAMRQLAQTAQRLRTSVRLTGARPVVRRGWQSAGFAAIAPLVELAG